MASRAPHDADDALFAVNYITGITTPLKPLIFHYQVAHLFVFRSPPPSSGFTSPKLATTHFVRSSNLKPCPSAGFRDVYFYFSVLFYIRGGHAFL